MQLIISPYLSPERNLALEEYLFKNSNEDICFFYRNTPSVIIGKHQNAFAEVNLAYCKQHNIPVLRRISGGGTVYHDEGNINISLIKTETSENRVNYQPLLDLIIHFLSTLNLKALQGERNDLYLKEKKITGTACHIFKSRTLHHGTLLFDANMRQLKASTKVDLEVETKGVQSRRSSVINTASLMKAKMEGLEFLNLFCNFCREERGWALSNVSFDRLPEIDAIIEERYAKPAWNIDYSPKATIHWRIDDKTYRLLVIKGIIEEITMEGDETFTRSDMPGVPLKGMLMRQLLMI